MGYTEVRSVEHTIVSFDSIATLFECCHELLKKLPVLPNGQSTDVLKYKVFGSQFENQPNEVINKFISRIVERPLPD